MRSLWARITGKDKGKTFPNQQTSALGRVGDDTIIYPYGLYCDLPDGARVRTFGNGYSIPVTVKRPGDLGRGEPVFFHPETNTRIIARNDGTLDIDAGESGVNITCSVANITAAETNISGNATIDGNLAVGGNTTTTGTSTAATVAAVSSLTVGGVEMANHIHSQANDSRGDTEVDTGGPHA